MLCWKIKYDDDDDDDDGEAYYALPNSLVGWGRGYPLPTPQIRK